MDIRKVKKLIELLEESGLSEIEITEGEDTVRITRRIPKDAKQTKVYTSLNTETNEQENTNEGDRYRKNSEYNVSLLKI